jgi:hypothetical protein
MGAGLGANRQTHAEIALMSLMSITFLLIHARTTHMQTSANVAAVSKPW